MNFKQAVELRNQDLARQASSADSNTAAAAKKIANVVADELNKALGGLAATASTAANEAVNNVKKAKGKGRNAQEIKEKFVTNDRNMTETQREKLVDPSNNNDALKGVERKLDKTLGVVEEIKKDQDKGNEL